MVTQIALESTTLDDFISQFRVVARESDKPVTDDILETLSDMMLTDDKYGKRLTAFGPKCKIAYFSRRGTGEDYLNRADDYMARIREEDHVPTKIVNNGCAYVYVDKTRSSP